MGAAPKTALALAVVPHGGAAYQESELGDLLAGALAVLSAAGCTLAGGHSSEGTELAAGVQELM
jgi:selenide,water dikinase